MLDPEKVALLRQVPLVAPLLDKNSKCLDILAEGEEVRLAPGELLASEGDPAFFSLVLEGEIRITKKVGEGEMMLGTWTTGVFLGEIPLLLGTPFVATGTAVTSCRLWTLQPDSFWKLMTQCPELTREILRVMAGRVKGLESVSQTREKLVSLGTLAAGLAHELNNPAAAARRGAKQLRELFDVAQERSLRLHQLGLQIGQCDSIIRLRREAVARGERHETLDTLAQSDREDELTAWMESKGINDGWEWSPTLAHAGVDVSWLEELDDHAPPNGLGPILGWLDATLQADSLAQEIEMATAHISDLVGAVKSYSYLDQALEQEVDLHDGLESTLKILKHKMRNVEVVKDFDRTLPTICAHGSELNQVWTNLLDNAADAMGGKGKISIRTCRNGQHAVVEIEDNGPGIPEAVQGRIFEPFFTTKAVGTGTGLGLDIAHRIITGRHAGDLSFTSEPGKTVFTARLPLNAPA